MPSIREIIRMTARTATISVFTALAIILIRDAISRPMYFGLNIGFSLGCMVGACFAPEFTGEELEDPIELESAACVVAVMLWCSIIGGSMGLVFGSAVSDRPAAVAMGMIGAIEAFLTFVSFMSEALELNESLFDNIMRNLLNANLPNSRFERTYHTTGLGR